MQKRKRTRLPRFSSDFFFNEIVRLYVKCGDVYDKVLRSETAKGPITTTPLTHENNVLGW